MTTKATEQKDNHVSTVGHAAVYSGRLSAPLVNVYGVTQKPGQPAHQVGR